MGNQALVIVKNELTGKSETTQYSLNKSQEINLEELVLINVANLDSLKILPLPALKTVNIRFNLADFVYHLAFE